MIVVYHRNNKVVSDHPQIGDNLTISQALFALADKNRDAFIIWCNLDLKSELNLTNLTGIFHHNKIMASYNASDETFFRGKIGYVEESPFIKISKDVRFPTWQMSSDVGGIHSSVLNILSGSIKVEKDFDYFLCSLAKMAMPLGLLCYSHPDLLVYRPASVTHTPVSNLFIFRFVKQHYKTVWVFLLFLDFIFYEKRFPIGSLLACLFFKRRQIIDKRILNSIIIESKFNLPKSRSIDVIIPTIGRKKYLYDVLKDLSIQTQLPLKVIIVEQNPLQGSVSELDYLTSESWPFQISHHFTNQPGVCNARNIALQDLENDWVFFADDDIRISADFLEKFCDRIDKLPNHVFTLSCFQKGQIPKYECIHQTSIFATGSSIASRESLNGIQFRMGFEFGFGEDSDFGRQLLNRGYDIYYISEPSIFHLKAPVGGSGLNHF